MAREHLYKTGALALWLCLCLSCDVEDEDPTYFVDAGSMGEGALLFHAQEKDAVEVTSASALELGVGADQTITIEGWIRIDRDLAGAIFSKRWTLDPGQTDYMLWIQPGLGLVWATGSPEDACAWMHIELPTLGQWCHVAMTLEADGEHTGHKALFLNGEKMKECDYQEKGPAHDDDFLIGTAEHLLLLHGIHDHFSGAIDELHLSKDILYRASFVPPASIIPNSKSIAFWDFTVLDRDQLPDLTGNGHDGRIFGAQSINASR